MTTKICPHCSQNLPISQFTSKNGKVQGYCRECASAYWREYNASRNDRKCNGKETYDGYLFHRHMLDSGYTSQEINVFLRKVKYKLYNIKDLLDYFPCKCGELQYECHPHYLNRMRKKYKVAGEKIVSF